MKFLEKVWIRILVSLLGASFTIELVHVSTGDPNRPDAPGTSTIMLSLAVFIFFVLTMYVRIKK